MELLEQPVMIRQQKEGGFVISTQHGCLGLLLVLCLQQQVPEFELCFELVITTSWRHVQGFTVLYSTRVDPLSLAPTSQEDSC